MKTFNRSLRVVMSHNVVPRVPSVVFSPGTSMRGCQERGCLSGGLWKTVENVLKLT